MALLQNVSRSLAAAFLFSAIAAGISGIPAAPLTIDISGVVKDRSTGEPLPNASVGLAGGKYSVISNVDGRFAILGINAPSDSFVLTAARIGFQTLYLTLGAGKIPATVVCALDPVPTTHGLNPEGQVRTLDTMVVTAQRRDKMFETSDISHVTLNPANIGKLPSIGQADVFRSLQLLPGISGTNESESGLYVEGGTPDQNLVLFDGFNVYYVDHFFGFFSAFNPQAIQDIQLYKGGFPAKYGGRTSSVMDITGKSGDMNNFNIAGGLSLLSGDVLAEIPLFGKGSLVLVGRRSYTDVIQSPLYDELFGLYNNNGAVRPSGGRSYSRGGGGAYRGEQQPSYYFYDLNAKATVQPTDKDVVSYSVYGGKDNLDNSANSSFSVTDSTGATTSNTIERKDIEDWGNWGMSGKWGRQWNNRFHSNVVLAYSNYFSDRVNDAQRDYGGNQTSSGTDEDNHVADITARLDNELLLPQSNLVGFGGQITRMQTTYHLTQNDTNDLLDSRDSALLFSGYVQDEFSGLGGLTLLPGFRMNYYQGTHSYYFEPRLSATYAITDRIKAKAAWGEYYQFVNHVEREDITEGSRDFWLLADSSRSPVSSAQHFILGGSYETPLFLLDVEAYRKVLSKLSEVSLQYGVPTNGQSVRADSLFFQGNGVSQGIEFLLQKKIGMYTGWIGYTLGKVEYTFPGMNNGNSFPADQDQTHELKLVNSLSIKKWDFSATWVYATGKPYTRPVGIYDIELLNGTAESFIHVGETNAYRLPDYHRLDVAATYNCMFAGLKTSFGISVFNVYDRKNVWYKTFESVNGNLVETDVLYLGITPSIFVNFSLK
jgi:ferric enterobactin receptor